ncbi:MAG: hypothetical protein R6X33_08100 [Candidatus Brocadiia bacterium]
MNHDEHYDHDGKEKHGGMEGRENGEVRIERTCTPIVPVLDG